MAERRRGGLARLPDFGASAEDRLLGSSVAPAEERQPSRRRPLKVDESLADQLRNAVLFMRGRGQPELTQNELLDELLAKGLQWLRDEANGGEQFPSTQRRRTGAR